MNRDIDEETAMSLEKVVEDSGWKEKIPPSNKGFLEWDKELIFNVRTQRGYEVEYDAQLQWGCSPTETLLMSLAGCLAIDVVSFLQKMRCDLKRFRIDYEGMRNPTPPQYYTSIDLLITIAGKGITPKKIEKAIGLSQKKYCSVYHSLRKDIKVKVDYRIEDSD